LTVPLAVSLILTGANPSAAFSQSTDAGIVQLVVGDAITLSAADLVLLNELTDMAYDVRVRDDGDPDTSSASTVVVVAPSATASNLGTKYATSLVPEVILGNDDWGNLNLANTSGNSYGTTNLIIVDSSNPIADGLPSTFAPATGYFPLHVVNGANMPPSADDVAVRSNADGSSSDALFTYKSGNTMANGATAAGARVALGYTEETLNNLSDDGQHLLDNAIYWADNENVASQAAAGTAPNVKGRWPLATIKPNANGTPGSTPNALNTAGEDGQFFPDSTVCSNVSTNCPRRPSPYADKSMLYFPGWTDAVQQNGTYVLPSGTASAAYIPHNALYEPGAVGSFSVSAYIRPTDSTMAPQIAVADDTLNIIQEGLASLGPGQDTAQWKMSINKMMYPNCQFKGYTDTVKSAINVKIIAVPAVISQAALLSTEKYLVQCSLVNRASTQTATLSVSRVESTGITPLYQRSVVAHYAMFNVTNVMDVWIGKKPNKTYPGDAYAGYIGNVVIKKSS